MFTQINEFLNDYKWIKFGLDAWFIFIVVLYILIIMLRSQRTISTIVPLTIFSVLVYFVKHLDLPVANELYPYFLIGVIVMICLILSPEITKKTDIRKKRERIPLVFDTTREKDNNAITDALMDLSIHKTGALITLERHHSLDQYADKAIPLNAIITKEILLNIFIPNTPLHDGAVIIRGNKIRCAGAYYVLGEDPDFDKTTGSRHRAAIGISQVTDALTLVVSEETGTISVAVNGIMLKLDNRESIMEYLDKFTK